MIFETTILATFILAVLLLTVPKKYFLLPFILAACFIPADQRILIFDLDFTPLRILVVVGFLRTVLLAEPLKFKWNSFDKLVMAWAICGSIIYVIQWSDMRAFIYKCGIIFNIIGLYWQFRLNIHSWSDIKLATKILAICSLVMAVLVGLEWLTGKNPFVIMGRAITPMREGWYRCRASFPHSILLGLFWVTIFPLFVGLAHTENLKYLYWAAAAASIFIVAATVSSTPYLTLFMVIIILCGYRWRQYTHFAAWGFIILAIALHIIMTGPVWSLIAKMTVVPGSTGIHRFNIINQAINHFSEWAFLGIRDTIHWGPGLRDITNQYVFEGVTGGLITLILFLIMLYTALRLLVHLSLTSKNHQKRFLVWCFFVVIAGNCISFFGVIYTSQIQMIWNLMLASVSFLSETQPYIKHRMVFRSAENRDWQYQKMNNQQILSEKH